MEFVLEGTPRVPGHTAWTVLSPLLPQREETSVESAAGTITGADWRAVADELAGALRATILRNPTVTARDWNQARAALERYEHAGVGTGAGAAAELTDQPKG